MLFEINQVVLQKTFLTQNVDAFTKHSLLLLTNLILQSGAFVSFLEEKLSTLYQ